MYNLQEFFGILDGFAPLSLSHRMIERGDYDNSGIIVKSTDKVQRVLFTLDLTLCSINKAKELDCDTIVTHHPAIYTPIKTLGLTSQTLAVCEAIKSNINVISMHLNLDIANDGIDENFAKALGGENASVLQVIDGQLGYGREFKVKECEIDRLVEKLKDKLGTKNIVFYGDKTVKKMASFCGGGSTTANQMVQNGNISADTIITSDMPHHIILSLIESGKNVILVPHYVAEEIGFNKFYKAICEKVKDNITIYYFDDKRFR